MALPAISTDTDGLNDEHIHLHLAPILRPWFQPGPQDESPRGTRFQKYLTESKTIFDFVSPQDSDAIVYPLTWQGMQKSVGAEHYTRFYEKHNHRKILIFYLSDFSHKIGLGGEYVFRTSLNRKRRDPKEHAMPGWSEDLVHHFSDGVTLHERPQHPVVGFNGFAAAKNPALATRLKQKLQMIAYRSGWEIGNVGAIIRREVLEMLAKNSDIDLRATVHQGFFGGVQNHQTINSRLDQFTNVRQQYVNSLTQCHYTLCARGLGNYSFRFFETASCGRIPLYIDTHGVLPFENLVDYQGHMPIVKFENLKSVNDVLNSFHENLSNADFLELQKFWRNLWEEKFEPAGFFRSLATQFL